MLRFPVHFAVRGEDVSILPTAQDMEALAATVDAETMDGVKADMEAVKGCEGVTVVEAEMLFDAPTLPTRALIDAEGWRRAADMAEREAKAARAENRAPRFGASSELVNTLTHQIRPEMTFRGMEGAEGYSTWASVPDALKVAAANWLAPHYQLTKAWADFLPVRAVN